MPAQPTIVCLCGSTRFSEAFQKANFDETLAGRIVLTIGCDMRSDEALHLTDQDKQRLDELHKRKVDLADEILVLNVGGYVGASTASEIDYARAHNKRIRWLEPPAEDHEKQVRAFLQKHGWTMRIRATTDHMAAPYIVRATHFASNRTVDICPLAALDQETEHSLLQKIGATAP